MERNGILDPGLVSAAQARACNATTNSSDRTRTSSADPRTSNRTRGSTGRSLPCSDEYLGTKTHKDTHTVYG
eukprot:scaffold112079_cov18-Prasinocladus_malaysianus.AAC.1